MSSLVQSGDLRPVSEAVLHDAIAWQLQMGSGQATEADRQGLAQWLAAQPEHARAWRQLGEIDVALRPVAAPAVRAAVVASPGARRRRAASLLAVAVSAVLALGAVDRVWPWGTWMADHRTGTGERLAVNLPDRSVVYLDARSAIDLDFDGAQRTVVLRSGAIYIETAPGAPGESRPFVVRTPEGSLRALGTRFTVQRWPQGAHPDAATGAATRLTVVESAVAARPPECAAAPLAPCAAERTVRRGETVLLGDAGVGEPTPAQPHPPGWKDGMLVLEDRPLAEAVAEIARYRTGHVSVDPRVAGLRVTGTLPLADTDRALGALTAAVPVEIVYVIPWWVRVRAREDGSR